MSTDVTTFRKEYRFDRLSEENAGDDPYTLFEAWFRLAGENGAIHEPNAMALATAIVQARGEPALAREGLTRASEQVRQRLGAEHHLVAELAAHGVKLGLVPS